MEYIHLYIWYFVNIFWYNTLYLTVTLTVCMDATTGRTKENMAGQTLCVLTWKTDEMLSACQLWLDLHAVFQSVSLYNCRICKLSWQSNLCDLQLMSLKCQDQDWCHRHILMPRRWKGYQRGAVYGTGTGLDSSVVTCQPTQVPNSTPSHFTSQLSTAHIWYVEREYIG
jgi:hypothetical protein